MVAFVTRINCYAVRETARGFLYLRDRPLP